MFIDMWREVHRCRQRGDRGSSLRPNNFEKIIFVFIKLLLRLFWLVGFFYQVLNEDIENMSIILRKSLISSQKQL